MMTFDHLINEVNTFNKLTNVLFIMAVTAGREAVTEIAMTGALHDRLCAGQFCRRVKTLGQGEIAIAGKDGAKLQSAAANSTKPLRQWTRSDSATCSPSIPCPL